MMTGTTRVSRGSLVIGVMLVFIGATLFVDRISPGSDSWFAQAILGPVLLIGLGIARLVESPWGGPYKGLMLVSGGAWLLAIQKGWLEASTSWPLLIVALGVAVAVGGISRRRDPSQGDAKAEPRDRSFVPLAILGIWLSIFIMGRPGAMGWTRTAEKGNGTQLIHVMGNSSPNQQTGPFKGADVVSMMGRTELDLTKATLEPGETATVDVFTMWGRTVIKVPRDWKVDVGATTLMGETKDERKIVEPLTLPGTTEPPLLRIRGVVTMGNMAIRY